MFSGEHVLETLDHAWKHLLHEKSKVIPGKAKLYAAIVRSKKLSKITNFDQLDLSNLNLKSEDSDPYDCEKLQQDQVLGNENFLLEIDFNDKGLTLDKLFFDPK